MTPRQKQVLAAVIVATESGRWYRAAGSGERVTLASLFRGGYCARRTWRGAEGERNAAHEYQADELVMRAAHELRTERLIAAASTPKRA